MISSNASTRETGIYLLLKSLRVYDATIGFYLELENISKLNKKV